MQVKEHYPTHRELANHLWQLAERELEPYKECTDPRVRLAAMAAGSDSWHEVRDRLAARRLDDPTLLDELRHQLQSDEINTYELLKDAAETQGLLFIPALIVIGSWRAVLIRQPAHCSGAADFCGWFVELGENDRSAFLERAMTNTPAGWHLTIELSEPMTRGEASSSDDGAGVDFGR